MIYPKMAVFVILIAVVGLAAAVSSPAPTSAHTNSKFLRTADVDCNGWTQSTDALFVLNYVAGNPSESNYQPCPIVDSYVSRHFRYSTSHVIYNYFGDTDCDGDVDAVDALRILQFVGGTGFDPCIIDVPDPHPYVSFPINGQPWYDATLLWTGFWNWQTEP